MPFSIPHEASQRSVRVRVCTGYCTLFIVYGIVLILVVQIGGYVPVHGCFRESGVPDTLYARGVRQCR